MKILTFFLCISLSALASSACAQNTRSTNSTPANRNPENPAVIHPPKDIIPPTVSCVNNLSANLLATDQVSLYTSDFLLSASDNNTPVYQLRFGIRKAGSGSGFPFDADGNPDGSIIFDCDEQGAQPVELWVMDNAGNTSYCTSTIEIADEYSNCTSSPSNAYICLNQGNCQVDEVNYEINGTGLNGAPFTYYELNSQNCTKLNLPDGSSGFIKPLKDDNALNGVTTYDWILIKRHILGIEPFTSPYQWIAADANNDGLINTQDSVEIYRLIFGINAEFTHNTSWRFVKAGYQFPAGNPLSQPFPEAASFSDLQQMDTIRFIPVKVGDVNGSAVCNSMAPEASDRGIANLLEAEIQPNPTTGDAVLKVTVEQPEMLSLKLFDAAGRRVITLEYPGDTGVNRIQIPGAAMKQPGLYFWQLKSGNLSRSGKLLRQ